MLLGNSPLKSLFPRLKTSRSVIDSRLSGIHPERSLLFKVNSANGKVGGGSSVDNIFVRGDWNGPFVTIF